MYGNAIHHNSRAVLRAWEAVSALGTGVSVQPFASRFPDLGDGLFVLRRVSGGIFQFRNPSKTLNRFTGLDWSGANFLDMWEDAGKLIVQGAVKVVLDHYGPAILQGGGKTSSGRFVHYEMLLAPLDHCDSLYPRLLGFYQPTGPESVLGGEEVRLHTLFSLCVPACRARKHRLHVVNSAGKSSNC